MPIFRKRPIEVEAQRYNGENGYLFRHWGQGNISEHEEPIKHLQIKTKEGIMVASIGDWVIQGIQKELYPCKPDIFEATYEETVPF